MTKKKGKQVKGRLPSFLDLVGSSVGKMTVEEAKRFLDEMRAEDDG